MKFFVTVTLETSGECVVEAPTLEAAEEWVAREKDDRFRNWFLELNDSDYYTTVSPSGTPDSPDIYVDANGTEIAPPDLLEGTGASR